MVLINKFPVRWCSACFHNYHERIREQTRAYQQSPSGLYQGVIVSLATMFSPSLIVSVLMNTDATILAAFSIFVPMLSIGGLLSFFERTQLKLSFRLFAVSAASIAAISPIGTYLALVWRILQNPDLLNYNGFLLHRWNYLGKEWSMMWFVAPWSLLLVMPLQQRIWSRYKERMEFKYHPQVVAVK